MKKSARTEFALYNSNGQPNLPGESGSRRGHNVAKAVLGAALALGVPVGAAGAAAAIRHQHVENTRHEAAAAKEQAELAGTIGVEMWTAARRAMNDPVPNRDITQKRVDATGDAEADITMPTAAGSTIQVRVITKPNRAGLVDLDNVLFYSLTDTSPRVDGTEHVTKVQLTGPEGFSYFQGHRPGDKPGWEASATSYDLTAAGDIVPGSADVLDTGHREEWGSDGTSYGHADTAQTTAQAICELNELALRVLAPGRLTDT